MPSGARTSTPASHPAFTRASARSAVTDDGRRGQRVASLLGIALGVSFTICFLTGIFSHLAQHPPSWFTLPAQPAGLYRVTQGVHVATGIAAIPLLLAKLWSVYPKLFQWPPLRSVAHALERLSLIPLVAGSLFMLFSGVANIDLWYPLPLFFPAGHYWVAWLTMGALIVHIGAKAAVARHALTRSIPDSPTTETRHDRRRFLVAVGAASGLLTLLTVGETVNPLRRLALLAPRDPDVGTQGFPVNNAAREAGVVDAATDPAWRLSVTGAVEHRLELSRAELEQLPQREATLPIACVEGWSASRRWRGVSLPVLLSLAGAPAGASVTVRSLGRGLYDQSDLDADQTTHPDTLLALAADGETLALDHGYPVRLIGPDRPGVMQTKWLTEIEVRA
jgi:DMSO/TMAO reductase YedYZ molybdopterin-dependent catalytic subunit